MKAAKPIRLRCAIYTRKSSEEGLEQDFNSLHAQREACEAFIKSQAQEGWQLVPTVYDDGGYSGGNIERPALQQLLKDVEARAIQVIVVYKVDRLTRSLADFARIVERLDSQGASFVSVTQQFNTTSSMGRLTLNVLLSFAQFEREVTGERIRDKIAASKRKGLWMGGVVPLGYQPDGRTLKIVPQEAEQVRHLYERYLALGSVDDLAAELRAQGTKSKQGVSKRGNAYGGNSYSRGALYHLLRNPLYVGQIRHKDCVYPGQHVAIIEPSQWEAVQARLLAGAPVAQGRTPTQFPLAGKLFDNLGNRMTPSYSSNRSGTRYRYYVSQAVLKRRCKYNIEVPRIGAETIEQFVAEAVRSRIPDELRKAPPHRVVLGQREVELHFQADEEESKDEKRVIRLPVQLIPTKHETEIRLSGAPLGRTDPALIRALVRAHGWRARLESGEFTSIDALSIAEKTNPTYVAELLGLAFLAPAAQELILNGNHTQALSVRTFRVEKQTLNWRIPFGCGHDTPAIYSNAGPLTAQAVREAVVATGGSCRAPVICNHAYKS